MNRYFTKTFFKFFFGFAAIIALAFGVLFVASSLEEGKRVDTAAPMQ